MRTSIIKIGLFIAAALLMVLSLPRDAENHYIYEVNRPWAYSLLTAPFDIPVQLDSIRTRQIKDSIDRTFEPVFTRDITLQKTLTAQFAQRLNSVGGSTLTPKQRNEIVEQMRKIYDDGVVAASTYAAIRSGKIRSVRFITDNVAISTPASRFLSERMAYSALDSLFRDPAYRETLAKARPDQLLQPNILIDSAETARLLGDLYQKAMAPVGVIQQGERIIDKGDIVTPQLATILDTYEEMSNQRGMGTVNAHHYPLAGQILYVIVALGILYAYLSIFRPEYFNNLKIIIFLLCLLVGFAFLAMAMAGAINMGIYMVPLTIIPIMTVIFLDSRTALLVHMVMILSIAPMAPFALEFLFMQFVAGSVAIDSIKDLSRRGQLIRTATFVFIAYSLSYVAVEIMQSGSAESLVPRMFGNLGVNAVLVSFAYILLFLFERTFGFTSRVTLVELSDINNPLLRKLSEECPGTFQHSMAVSTLASAAAAKIGANVQLVRAGALYHDIGKTRNPAFFTENQHGVNPHEALADPLQSARIVISHIDEGLKMAEKAKLPSVIRDFIREHHGAGKARYFYNTYCNAHPDEDVDPAPFSYPGPNPRSRETSILMMADSVEAASRSLTNHSPEAIHELVDKIIDSQVKEGLHNDSPLSFRDIKQIKESFEQRLRTLYHSRIQYPDLKKPE